MWRLLAPCLALGVGCASSHPHRPLKKPNDELIVGDFSRRGSDGQAAIRFTADHGYRVVKSKAVLDQDPPLGAGTWALEGERLVLTAQKGMCADGGGGERAATYQVVISKVGIRFTKVEDSCERRATMDGQTWWRIR